MGFCDVSKRHTRLDADNTAPDVWADSAYGEPGSDSLSAVEDRQKKIDERGLKNRIYRKAHRDRAPGRASGLAYTMRRAVQLEALAAARAPI